MRHVTPSQRTDRLRRIALACAGALGLILLAVTLLGADRAAAATLSSEDLKATNEVSAYLNQLENLQGEFLQLGPDGSLAEGRFFLRRPGRLRFEFAPPTNMLVVADGTWVIVQEEEGRVADRYPINSTPLSLLLAPDIDLAASAKVVSVERQPGIMRLTLADPTGETPGELTLIFDEPELQLRQWIVRDAQGLLTTVTLRDVQRGIRADNSLFTIRQNQRPTIGGKR